MTEVLSRRRPTRAIAAMLLAFPAPLLALGGCANLLTDDGTTRIGTLEPGPATQGSNFFGVSFEPCTGIELEGYPPFLARASYDYYQGPWCASQGDTRTYLWAYARPMSSEQSAASVNQDVLADADQMALDLEAQGYQRVCGVADPGVRIDAGFESAGEATRIRLANRGQVADPPQATSTEPPALLVSVSPATRAPGVPEGAYAPPC